MKFLSGFIVGVILYGALINLNWECSLTLRGSCLQFEARGLFD